MKKMYLVEITETLQRTVEVEAESMEDALEIADEKYRAAEIQLNADNSYVGVDFSAVMFR